MATETPGGSVVVGVANPDHGRQLVRTAADLARPHGATVRLVTVAAKPHDSPFGVFSDETIRGSYAGESHDLLASVPAPAGVTVEREVVVARSVARGLLRAVAEDDPSALVVGWQGRSRRTDAVLGTAVDTLVARAPCDLYVERVGREADGVDSVLLPVAGGPHVRAAARAAGAVATQNGARVLVCSVRAPDDDRADAEAFVAEGREAVAGHVGPDVTVETAVLDGTDVTDAVVAATQGHDVVVLGATRQGAVRRRVAGTVPRRVAARTDRTVVLARDEATVGGLLGRLGGLLRR
jgi:nucleotide-binding universal stress UspA family protein